MLFEARRPNVSKISTAQMYTPEVVEAFNAVTNATAIALGTPYPVTASSLASYNRTFLSVHSGIHRAILDMRVQGVRRIVAVDIAGEGELYKGYPTDMRPDIVIGIVAKDEREEWEKEDDAKNDHYQIEGNAFLPSTWDRVTNILDELGVDGVNIFTFRPLAGMSVIPEGYPWLYDLLIYQMCSRRSQKSNLILAEVPGFLSERMTEWAKKMRGRNALVQVGTAVPDEDYCLERPVFSLSVPAGVDVEVVEISS